MISCEVCIEIKKQCPKCCYELEAKSVWLNLTASEKSLCIAYQRALKTSLKPNKSLIDAISAIYQKYPDFNLSVIP